MFQVKVQKNIASLTLQEKMTSGSQDVYVVSFDFSEEWLYLERTAVFKSGDVIVNVLLDNTNQCMIPWEVITNHGESVSMGVFGTRDGHVVLPTIWARTDPILEGVITGITPSEPTPDVYQQLLARLARIEDEIEYGGIGEPGSTFIPSVSESGELSWTNNGGLPNPDPVNVTGPKGDDGTTFIPSVSESGELTWINDGGLINPKPVNIIGPAGPAGTGANLTAGDGITISNDTISVSLPSKSLTKAEYDALTEEEKQANVQYIITDDNNSGGSGNGTSEEVYSTEETRIGTWIDGKPIYRMVVKTKTGNLNSYSPIITINNIDQLTNLRGVVYEKPTGAYHIAPNADLYLGKSIPGKPDLIWVYVKHENYVNTDGYYIIEYTKTTD